MARLLTATIAITGFGGALAAADVKTDIVAGAPTNKDGTVNLLHYAAWLAQQDAHRP